MGLAICRSIIKTHGGQFIIHLIQIIIAGYDLYYLLNRNVWTQSFIVDDDQAMVESLSWIGIHRF